MKHTIQALVENKFGVLARVSSLFSARGYNIDSLAVGTTEDSTISCITLVVNAEDERILEQIKKQLNKLIDVVTVIDLTKREHIDRELILAKIVLDKKDSRRILKEIKSKYDVRIVSEKNNVLVLEFVGDNRQTKGFLSEIENFEIKQLVRTGRIAMGY
ncbi:MAG: acetolactate synthase small subunit [Candidatus Omnitrophica bacterium]|nr:acetolactate synthase small subunit [Candidatus Omnitrophota bacterium]